MRGSPGSGPAPGGDVARRVEAEAGRGFQGLIRATRGVGDDQAELLPAGVVRRVVDAGRDVHGVARADGELLAVADHLAGLPGDHVEDLLGVRVVVAGVAHTGADDDLDERAVRAWDRVRGVVRLDGVPVECRRRYRLGVAVHSNLQAL